MSALLFAVLLSKPGLLAVGLGAGFGIGRIKNVKKLAAIHAVVSHGEESFSEGVKALAARIRAKL
jgi:hypothetical protein